MKALSDLCLEVHSTEEGSGKVPQEMPQSPRKASSSVCIIRFEVQRLGRKTGGFACIKALSDVCLLRFRSTSENTGNYESLVKCMLTEG